MHLEEAGGLQHTSDGERQAALAGLLSTLGTVATASEKQLPVLSRLVCLVRST